MKTKKIAEKSVQGRILANIAKSINEKLSIFWANKFEPETTEAQAKYNKRDGHVIVMADEQTCIFTGTELEIIMKVLSSYVNKYENLYYGMDTTPILRTKGTQVYWLYAPQFEIHFFYA